MRAPRDDESIENWTQYYVQLLQHTEGLPPTALVLAAEAIDFQTIFAGEES